MLFVYRKWCTSIINQYFSRTIGLHQEKRQKYIYSGGMMALQIILEGRELYNRMYTYSIWPNKLNLNQNKSSKFPLLFTFTWPILRHHRVRVAVNLWQRRWQQHPALLSSFAWHPRERVRGPGRSRGRPLVPRSNSVAIFNTGFELINQEWWWWCLFD